MATFRDRMRHTLGFLGGGSLPEDQSAAIDTVASRFTGAPFERLDFQCLMPPAGSFRDMHRPSSEAGCTFRWSRVKSTGFEPKARHGAADWCIQSMMQISCRQERGLRQKQTASPATSHRRLLGLRHPHSDWGAVQKLGATSLLEKGQVAKGSQFIFSTGREGQLTIEGVPPARAHC